MPDPVVHPASYRDPSGFVFTQNQQLYRQVNQSYADNYELLMRSGLYEKLQQQQLLLPHQQLEQNLTGSADWFLTLQPERIPIISYPWEWCFDQLQDAALLTLSVCAQAVEHGMILKDASALNVQFRNGNPVFIDSLSFEKHDTSQPWVAYRQFCQNFLFPLLLSHYNSVPVSRTFAAWPDGISVAQVAAMLPARSWLSLGVWLHVFLQNSVRGDGAKRNAAASFSKTKLKQLLENLTSLVRSLRMGTRAAGHWNNYYQETILSNAYLSAKEKLFTAFIADIAPSSVLDLGANDGVFSRLSLSRSTHALAIDTDEGCISNLYRTAKKERLPLLALVEDIASPAGPQGLQSREHRGFMERAAAELVLALAVVHHLFFTRNIPLERIADLLTALTTHWVIIEFVPPEDPRVQQLLMHKSVSHPRYTVTDFERICEVNFEIERKEKIGGSERTLYRLRKKHRIP